MSVEQETYISIISGAENPIIAGIDVGSNAIRLVIKKFLKDGSSETIAKRRYPVRLGHRVFTTGMLEQDLIDRASDLFVTIREILTQSGVTHYRAVATSAVREGKNRKDLVESIERKSGIKLEIISGTEEARLIYVAVKDKLPYSADNWVLIDLGGGSVEITHAMKAGFFTESKSYGVVRLLETTECDPDNPESLKIMEDYISSMRLDPHFTRLNHSGVIGTGGNIEEIAKIAQNKIITDDVVTITVSELDNVISTLRHTTFAQRQALYEMRPDRADIILPAAIIYRTILGKLGDNEITVPGVGVREGIIKDIIDNLSSHDVYAHEHDIQLQVATEALGSKYNFDRDHAVFVTSMAMSLFNQLKDRCQLDEEDRNMLETASMLHDIGQFISYDKHHKHSSYIIANSELPGFSKEQMSFIANIARYHRRSEPKPDHSGFAELTEEKKNKLLILSSILRLADALDGEHLQRNSDVKIDLEGTKLGVDVYASQTGLSEYLKISKKGQMMANIFGLDIKVREICNEKK